MSRKSSRSKKDLLYRKGGISLKPNISPTKITDLDYTTVSNLWGIEAPLYFSKKPVDTTLDPLDWNNLTGTAAVTSAGSRVIANINYPVTLLISSTSTRDAYSLKVINSGKITTFNGGSSTSIDVETNYVVEILAEVPNGNRAEGTVTITNEGATVDTFTIAIDRR